MKKGYIQQGDVLLIPVDHMQDYLKNLNAKHSPIIQLGEATGHAHRIDGSKYMQYENFGGDRYLKLDKSAVLRHEEHKPIKLLKGVYRIEIVREYDHFKEEQRRVVD